MNMNKKVSSTHHLELRTFLSRKKITAVLLAVMMIFSAESIFAVSDASYKSPVISTIVSDSFEDRTLGAAAGAIGFYNAATHPLRVLYSYNGTVISETNINGEPTKAIEASQIQVLGRSIGAERIAVSYKFKKPEGQTSYGQNLVIGDKIFFRFDGWGVNEFRMYNTAQAYPNGTNISLSGDYLFDPDGWNTVYAEITKTMAGGVTYPVLNYVSVNGEIIPGTENISYKDSADCSSFSWWLSGSLTLSSDVKGYYDDVEVREVEIPATEILVNEVSVSLENEDDTEAVTVANLSNTDILTDVYYATYSAGNKLIDLQVDRTVLLPQKKSIACHFNKTEGENRVFVWEAGELKPAPASVQTVVYPSESSEILKNPYRGYAYYSTNTFTDQMLSSPAARASAMGYTRIDWVVLEPQEGVYDWSRIDDNIAVLSRNNMTYGVGIGMCANIFEPYSFQATPLWVFDAGADYTEVSTVRGMMKIPVWNDEIFLTKYKNFIDAFAARYNGNPNISFVDMRSYGNWGEWHLLDLTGSVEPSEEDKKLLIDVWENVTLPLLFFGDAKSELYDYANSNLGAGLRTDGVMNPRFLNNHKKLMSVMGRGPAVAEWYSPAYEGYQTGGVWSDYKSYMPIYFERVINEGGVSIIGLSCWDADVFYNENKSFLDRVSNKVGYWFKPTKIEFPKKLTSGIFKMRVKNDGAAPLYTGHGQNSCVKLAALDSADNILETVILSGVSPEAWQAGAYADISAEYAFTNSIGIAKLAVGVFTDEMLISPDINLGISGDRADGFYILDTMPTTEEPNFAAGKLYSASPKAAEYGYGFLSAESAFDSNPATYWSSEGRKGFLEIDFGETKTFDTISLNASGQSGFSVSVPNGNNWNVIYSSPAIPDGIAALGAPVTASRVRMTFGGQPPPAEAKQLLKNRDFEYPFLFDGSWENYSMSWLNVETGMVHGGGKSAKIYNRNTCWYGISQDVTGEFLKYGAGRYRLKAFVYPVGGAVNLRTILQITYKDGTSSNSINRTTLCGADTWTEANSGIRSLAVNGQIEKVMFIIETGANETNDLYIDDCSVVFED